MERGGQVFRRMCTRGFIPAKCFFSSSVQWKYLSNCGKGKKIDSLGFSVGIVWHIVWEQNASTLRSTPPTETDRESPPPLPFPPPSSSSCALMRFLNSNRLEQGPTNHKLYII